MNGDIGCACELFDERSRLQVWRDPNPSACTPASTRKYIVHEIKMVSAHEFEIRKFKGFPVWSDRSVGAVVGHSSWRGEVELPTLEAGSGGDDDMVIINGIGLKVALKIE